ncbi:hypothetical protein [Thermomonospora cellulosilytica]|uniref:Uncharacterized protein n=1 Tax=Thermomonospora cellulosilytica TaxID=1411118 RepID=A0A7W3MX32_9ACTN|nr:hypothetical protein [Thermomonospora cellulosilytica]MBA9003461.1 hypothetical protein [Thermomonospora cellulosilytica]
MFPQPKKYGQMIAGVVAAIYVFNNPAQAAEFVNKAVAAISTFAGALG